MHPTQEEKLVDRCVYWAAAFSSNWTEYVLNLEVELDEAFKPAPIPISQRTTHRGFRWYNK
jgi:hypothetical protein